MRSCWELLDEINLGYSDLRKVNNGKACMQQCSIRWDASLHRLNNGEAIRWDASLRKVNNGEASLQQYSIRWDASLHRLNCGRHACLSTVLGGMPPCEE